MLDEHASHHPDGAYVAHRFCDGGRVACGSDGYIQGRAGPGRMSVVMFVPETTGTFNMTDPEAPDLGARIIVF
jgi:hypothetical protein